jgi:hypothetical protein
MFGSVLKRLVSSLAFTLVASLVAVQACTAAKSPDDRLTPDHCAHKRPPPPPKVRARGGTLELIFAVSQTVLGTAPEGDAGWLTYQKIGFDLDNTCTSEGQQPSCVAPASAASHKDGVDGIDNAIGQVWWELGSGVSTADPNFTEVLLRVRDYSGDPDDDQVEASLYYAFGLSAREDGGVGPFWDGQDKWNVLPASLHPPADGEAPNVDEPMVVDKHAYVSGGVLVAQFDQAFTAYATAPPTLLWPIRQLLMAGTLKQNGDGTWEIQNAMIGSRVALTVVAQAIASFQPYKALGPICRSPSFYRMEVLQACSFADIAYSSDSPSAPCDALSMGLMVQAKQAKLGEVLAPPLASSMCNQSELPDANPCEWAGDE